jgi:predicted nucleic acid-binding Zn ribbon protein
MDVLQTEKWLRGLAKGINQMIIEDLGGPNKWGFVFLIFPLFKASGLTNYISNCQRDDMIKALRDCANRLEKGQTFPPIIPRRNTMSAFQETVYITLRHKLCLICKRPLPEDYEFSYCCNGRECGCYGLPPEPWLCSKTCGEILYHRMDQYKRMWT